MDYIEKGNKYYKVCVSMQMTKLEVEHLPLIQLAAECYLKAVLIKISGKQNLEEIYGKAQVPHNLKTLYNDIFNENKISQENQVMNYNCSLRRHLDSLFGDYNATRLPGEYYRDNLTSEDLDDDFDFMVEAKEFCELFYEKHNDKIKMNKEH